MVRARVRVRVKVRTKKRLGQRKYLDETERHPEVSQSGMQYLQISLSQHDILLENLSLVLR